MRINGETRWDSLLSSSSRISPGSCFFPASHLSAVVAFPVWGIPGVWNELRDDKTLIPRLSCGTG